MNLNEVVIETKRLKLVPINMSHVMDVYKYFTIDVTEYMYPQSSRKVEDTEEFVASSMKGLEEGTNLQMVMLDKDTEEFIGCIGLHNIGTKDPELGVWVKKRAHSHGYGMEGVRELVRWAQKNIEYDHMKYPVDRHNRSSRRIPLTCGGKFVKSYKRLNSNATKELDIVEYWIK